MTTTGTMSTGERRAGDAMWKGFRCRCPHCGEGKLFGRFRLEAQMIQPDHCAAF